MEFKSVGRPDANNVRTDPFLEVTPAGIADAAPSIAQRSILKKLSVISRKLVVDGSRRRTYMSGADVHLVQCMHHVARSI